MGDELWVVGDADGLDDRQFETAPRYCPRCQRDQPEHHGSRSLCIHCGETLRPRGYCAVCETYWKLPAGAECPKHDIPLDAQRPSDFRDPSLLADTTWVTVKVYPDSLSTEAPRLRLEAEGIPTFVEGERMGSPSMYPVATGGVKLQVPENLVTDARILLAQTWTPPTDEDDLDDAWESLEPEPWAARVETMRGLIVLVLFGPLILWAMAWILGADLPSIARGFRR